MKRITIYVSLVFMVMYSCVPSSQFKEVETKKNNLQENRDQLFAENERLNVDYREMKSVMDQVEAQKQQFIEDSLRLHDEIVKAQNEIFTIDKKYKDLQATHESLLRGNARETRRLLNELQSTQEDLSRKQEMLRDLEGNVSEQRQEVTVLRAELEARNARLMELEEMLYKKDELMDNLKMLVSNALLGFEGQGLTVTQKNGKVYVSLQNKLLFGSGSTSVDQNGVRALKQLATVLAENADIDIMIEGHTDNVPFRQGSTIKDNWDLSVLRATSIVRILLSDSGINPKRITVAGRGEFLPIDEADTPEARSINRRTEIILSPDLDELFSILDLN